VRFTLGQDITAAIPPGEGRLFDMALDIASNLTPLNAKEREELLAKAAAVEPIFRA